MGSKNLSPQEFGQFMAKLNKSGMPNMVSETINSMAQEASRLQKVNIEKRMEVRNPRYTLGSLRYWKSKPMGNISSINAVVGSISPYLPVQDEGGDVRPYRGKYKNIPITKTSRAGGNFAGKVLRRYRMDRALGDHSSAFILHVQTHGDFLGVFIRIGGKLRLVQKLSHKGVKIKETSWHTDAMKRAGEDAPLIQQVWSSMLIRAIKK